MLMGPSDAAARKSSRYCELKPMDSGSPLYSFSIDSLASPYSALEEESSRPSLASANFTACERWSASCETRRRASFSSPRFNYEAVLPRENNKAVVLERGELNDALRRVSQLADQRSHAVKFALAKEGLELSSSSAEYGEAKESIEKEYKGDPLSIGFNSQYLLDFLAAASEGPISIEFKDEQSAGQMRPLADEQYRYRYVIMPMRI